jgi:hypothetical protein
MRRLTVGEAVSDMAMAGTAAILYLTADSLWVKRASRQDEEDIGGCWHHVSLTGAAPSDVRLHLLSPLKMAARCRRR